MQNLLNKVLANQIQQQIKRPTWIRLKLTTMVQHTQMNQWEEINPCDEAHQQKER